MLFEDDVGGLEVQDRDGNFIPVQPFPDTLVLNAGDVLKRWTNGKGDLCYMCGFS